MSDGEVGFKNLNSFMQGILVLVSILLIVVPPVCGFLIIGRDVQDNTEGRKEHLELIKVNMSDIHSLEVRDAQQETRDIEILRRLDEIRGEIKTWDVKLSKERT